MTDPLDDIAALKARLAAGPRDAPPERQVRIRKPIYLLTVDELDDLSIVLVIRTSRDGITRATIALPEWQELPEGWDGPHEMHVAVPLADDYAHEYGYHGIAIDIESSQLWDPLGASSWSTAASSDGYFYARRGLSGIKISMDGFTPANPDRVYFRPDGAVPSKARLAICALSGNPHAGGPSDIPRRRY